MKKKKQNERWLALYNERERYIYTENEREKREKEGEREIKGERERETYTIIPTGEKHTTVMKITISKIAIRQR